MSDERLEPEAAARRGLWGLAGLAVAGSALGAIGPGAESAGGGPLALRHPSRRLRARGAPPVPSAGVVTLNRAAFGPRPGDLAAFEALGGNDEDRVAAWVAEQLEPELIDDSDLDGRFAAAGYVSFDPADDLDTNLARLWDWYVNGNAPGGETSSGIPRDELIRSKFLRAIYSRRQLFEVLVDHWHGHFSVFIEESTAVRATFPHFDMALRAHALGNFRDMLEAVARSPSMLYYLDNYTSSNAGPNENFARELFEVMTLGAENYLGVANPFDVPTDGGGRPIGYVDNDVYEATRALTGWSFAYGNNDADDGLFLYRPDWHDRFNKIVLGNFLPADQADMQDGWDVLDALAEHPGTARHVCRRLCRRLVADEPSETLVQAAADVFHAQWQAPDQLKQVVETILLSEEFRTTWGEKVKRPFEIAVSALRAGAAEMSFTMDDDSTQSFLWRFDDTGHEPFHWPAPNGFPDTRDAWISMTPRVMSWRLLGALIDLDDSGPWALDVLAQTPSNVRSANALADFWIDRCLGREMAPEDRDQIVQFMAQGINPDFDLDFTESSTTDRLRSMVGLLFMSPDFLWR